MRSDPLEPGDVDPDKYLSDRRQKELEELAQRGDALFAIRLAVREAVAAHAGNYVQRHRQC